MQDLWLNLNLNLILSLIIPWSSRSIEVPHRYRGICRDWNNLFFIRAPMDFSNWSRVTQSLSCKGEIVQPIDCVNKDFISFCAKSYELPTRAHLNRKNLVRIHNFCDGSSLITVPEVYGGTLATSDKFKFVVLSLRHTEEGSILCLVSIDSLFLFQVISGDRSVHWAWVNLIGLA